MSYSNSLTIGPMKWMGAWDAAFPYVPGATVTYGGGTFVAIASSTGVTPVAGAYWAAAAAGTAASLAETQVGFGDASDLLSGSAGFTYAFDAIDENAQVLQIGPDSAPGDNGPMVIIKSGLGGDSGDSGGSVTIRGTLALSGALGGFVTLNGGTSGGTGGEAALNGGDADTGAGSGGRAVISGGDANVNGGGGIGQVNGGNSSSGATGGQLKTNGGESGGNGGDVVLTGGAKTGGGTAGLIVVLTLPTSAPATTGALWRDAAAGNVVKCVP